MLFRSVPPTEMRHTSTGACVSPAPVNLIRNDLCHLVILMCFMADSFSCGTLCGLNAFIGRVAVVLHDWKQKRPHHKQ